MSRYDAQRYPPGHPAQRLRVKALDATARMRLAGNMRRHVGHPVPMGRAQTEARSTVPDLVPRLAGVGAGRLARQVHAKGGFSVTADRMPFGLTILHGFPTLIASYGRRCLIGIAGRDWAATSAACAPVHETLRGLDLPHYPGGARQ